MLIINPYKNHGLFPKTIYLMVFGPPGSSGSVLSSLLVELESRSKIKKISKISSKSHHLNKNTPLEIQRLQPRKSWVSKTAGFLLFQGSICWKKMPGFRGRSLALGGRPARLGGLGPQLSTGMGCLCGPSKGPKAWRADGGGFLKGHLLYKKNPEVCYSWWLTWFK